MQVARVRTLAPADPIKYEQALDCVAALGEKALPTADAVLRDTAITLITKLVGGFTDHVTVSRKEQEGFPYVLR